jgi:hypothetical protein
MFRAASYVATAAVSGGVVYGITRKVETQKRRQEWNQWKSVWAIAKQQHPAITSQVWQGRIIRHLQTQHEILAKRRDDQKRAYDTKRQQDVTRLVDLAMQMDAIKSKMVADETQHQTQQSQLADRLSNIAFMQQPDELQESAAHIVREEERDYGEDEQLEHMLTPTKVVEFGKYEN